MNTVQTWTVSAMCVALLGILGCNEETLFATRDASTSDMGLGDGEVDSGDANDTAVPTETGLICNAPNRLCNNICVACPSDANAIGLACRGNSCVIGACRPRFSVNGTGTACTAVPADGFLGAPLTLTRPSGADDFGYRVSLSDDGNTLVVGDADGGGDENGSATVYVRTNGAWDSGTSLMRPSDAGKFGASVSLSGDGNTLVVGDWWSGGNQHGSATVYDRNGDAWSTGTSLMRPSGAVVFGASVSLSDDGNTLVVGASAGGGDQRGSATVYVRTGGAWDRGTSVIRPLDASRFGGSVSLSADGNILVVGDINGEPDSQGSATVYVRRNGSWSSGTNLTRPTSAVDFGGSVALSGDGNTVVVGDIAGGGNRNGLATVYVRSADTWSSGTNLTVPRGAVDFGASVSLSGDGNTLAVGDSGGSLAMVYVRNADAWSSGTNLAVPGGVSAQFGASVSMSGDGNTLAVGDFQGGGDGSGDVSVYVR